MGSAASKIGGYLGHTNFLSQDSISLLKKEKAQSNCACSQKSDILPVLQQALSLNPSLKFMANPWSPPAWMKTNGSMLGVHNGQIGTLISLDYGPLAQYFVKFMQAYQAQGIPIYAITPQNEPLYAPDSYPAMFWGASDENSFIKNNLSFALTKANLHPKIIPYDHNWDNIAYAQTLLSDPVTNRDIAGVSWHCYAGSPSACVGTVRNLSRIRFRQGRL